MRVTKKGKIVDDFYVMGHANVPVYLLDGPKPALFDAGFMALAKCYEQDIKKILGSRSPAYLFLTHSHFDHVGAAGYLKKVWPDLRTIFEPGAGEHAGHRYRFLRPGAGEGYPLRGGKVWQG